MFSSTSDFPPVTLQKYIYKELCIKIVQYETKKTVYVNSNINSSTSMYSMYTQQKLSDKNKFDHQVKGQGLINVIQTVNKYNKYTIHTKFCMRRVRRKTPIKTDFQNVINKVLIIFVYLQGNFWLKLCPCQKM